MVRAKGLEPSRREAHAPKACVSTIPPRAHIIIVSDFLSGQNNTSLISFREKDIILT